MAETGGREGLLFVNGDGIVFLDDIATVPNIHSLKGPPNMRYNIFQLWLLFDVPPLE